MPTKRKPRAAQLGVTDAEYDRLLAAQGGGCAICGNPPKTRRLHVDHDHKTGRVRGLLCHRDNRILPSWATVDWLDAAYRYMARNELQTAGRLRYATQGECWVWLRAISSAGYPVIRFRGQLLYVHRLMSRGLIPKGHVVHHRCEHRWCVNPDHLEVMPHAEHTRYHAADAATCKRGHPWTPENTYLRPDNGLRQCRACIRLRSAA